MESNIIELLEEAHKVFPITDNGDKTPRHHISLSKDPSKGVLTLTLYIWDELVQDIGT